CPGPWTAAAGPVIPRRGSARRAWRSPPRRRSSFVYAFLLLLRMDEPPQSETPWPEDRLARLPTPELCLSEFPSSPPHCEREYPKRPRALATSRSGHYAAVRGADDPRR